MPAIGDDSGIAAAALGGRPGVHSARFAGPEATDEQNLDLLLAELEGHEDRSRRLRLRHRLRRRRRQPSALSRGAARAR